MIGLVVVWSLQYSALLEGMRAIAAPGGSARVVTALCAAVVASGAGGILAAALATFAQTHGLSLRALTLRLQLAPPLGIDAASGVARSTLAIVAGLAIVCCVVRPVPEALARVVEAMLALGTIAALVDMFVVRKAWRRRLRMSFDEFRREMREHDGDPQARARRRRLHRQMMRGSLRNVRRATFVIVNPAHLAIALRYIPDETPVPMILVRAADDAALRVKRLAAEVRIPTIENPPLARQLYAHDALGPIPPELYLAVAQIVAALQRGT